MAQTIVMPKLGLTMTEGVLTAWHKKEGDSVAAGEKIFDVETDKLTNTVEAPCEGILRKILVSAGSTVNCLVPVGVIGTAQEDISAFTSGGPAPKQEAPASAPAPQQVAQAQPQSAASESTRVIAAPAAKKLAQEKGVDISLVTGTGPNGRITIEDVENYAKNPSIKQASSQASAPPQKISPLAAKMAAEQGIDLKTLSGIKGRIMSSHIAALAECCNPTEIRVQMSGMRKVIAKRMRESADISPRVTFDISVDMTAQKRAKEEMAKDGLKVSYTDIIVKTVSAALLAHPQLNCTVDGDHIIYRNYVNMGIAVALEEGLLVPVLNNSHVKTLAQISAEVKDLAEKAKSGSLSPDLLSGGTFTITNLGMFSIESFTPIINQPQVAILGVNRMVDTPVVIDGQITARPIMKFSLAADHRAVDGAVAAMFLSTLKKYLEQPMLML